MQLESGKSLITNVKVVSVQSTKGIVVRIDGLGIRGTTEAEALKAQSSGEYCCFSSGRVHPNSFVNGLSLLP